MSILFSEAPSAGTELALSYDIVDEWTDDEYTKEW